jgi:hypothetical protein
MASAARRPEGFLPSNPPGSPSTKQATNPVVVSVGTAARRCQVIPRMVAPERRFGPIATSSGGWIDLSFVRVADRTGPIPQYRTTRGKRHVSRDEILVCVPTVLVAGPYRMYFYSHEPNEPPPIHVDRDDQSAKFWLYPVALARNLGFGPAELRRVQRLVAENRTVLLEKWHERFPS